MPHTDTIDELLEQLQRAGRQPSERLVERILEHGAEARAHLLRLATATDLLIEEEPRCWGPVHALRLLGEVPDLAMILPLLERLPIMLQSNEDDPAHFWSSEVLDIASAVGPSAIPLLWATAEDVANGRWVRGAALYMLAHIAIESADQRDAIVAEARTRLAHSLSQPTVGATTEPTEAAEPAAQAEAAEPTEAAESAAQAEETIDRTLPTSLVFLLATLKEQSSYSEVMAAYRAGYVDTDVLPAARTRQMLLGAEPSGLGMRLPFWERYAQYGPDPRG